MKNPPQFSSENDRKAYSDLLFHCFKYLVTKDIEFRWTHIVDLPQLSKTILERVAWSTALLRCFRDFHTQGKTSEVEKCLKDSKENDIVSYVAMLGELGRGEEMAETIEIMKKR